MKIVVTGAAGFIGKAVVNEIIGRNLECIPVSRRKKLLFHNHFIIKRYEDTPQGDILIHLAENSNVSEVNSKGLVYKEKTLNEFTELIKKKYKRIVYASSSLIYGDKNKKKWNESDFVKPWNNYTSIKISCENIIKDSVNSYACARITNVYGHGMSNNNVFSDILKQINKKGPLLLRDDKPCRDYIHIRDVARGLVDLALGQSNGIFNLGSGENLSVRKLAEIILNCCKINNKDIRSLSENNKYDSCINVNIKKIFNEFGWEPKIQIKKGINQLIREQNDK